MLLGLRDRLCPNCGAELFDEQDGVSGSSGGALRRVKRGLTVIIALIVLRVLALIGLVGIGVMLDDPAVTPAEADTLYQVATGVLAALVMMAFAELWAYWLCMQVPEESRARGAIKMTLVLTAVTLVLSLGSISIAIQDKPDPQSLDSLQGVINLLSIAATLAFIQYLGKLSAYVNRSDLVERALGLIRLIYAIIFTVILTVVLLVVGARAGVSFPGLALLVMLILAVTRYLQLISRVRRAI